MFGKYKRTSIFPLPDIDYKNIQQEINAQLEGLRIKARMEERQAAKATAYHTRQVQRNTEVTAYWVCQKWDATREQSVRFQL